jgi:glycerophosphoryl diester phosphodiesterase
LTDDDDEWHRVPMRQAKHPTPLHSLTIQHNHAGPADAIHPQISVIGHRGAPWEELENTMAGFHVCRRHGAHGFELDVYHLKCGTLVAFHGLDDDGKLDDYCLLPGKCIGDYTYQEALALKFNPDYGEFGCPAAKTLAASIPTLEQVLLEFKGTGAVLKVELKGEGTVDPTLALVEQLGMVEQCFFCSFDISRVKKVRELRPQRNPDGTHVYKTSALFKLGLATFIEDSLDAGVTEVVLRYSSCTAERVQRIHEAGMTSVAWFRGIIGMVSDAKWLFNDAGNEDEAMYDIVMRTGVQGMIVNRTDVLVPLLKKRGLYVEKWSGEKKEE